MENAQKLKDYLFAYRVVKGNVVVYIYETDSKYFVGNQPSSKCLKVKTIAGKRLPNKNVFIENPWKNWSSSNPEMITSKQTNVPINFLKTTEHGLLQKEEDKRLLDTYSCIIDNFDIGKTFGFKQIQKWHKDVFHRIYSFAGDQRTVEMTKGEDSPWTWHLSFLDGIPELDKMIKFAENRT